jgi:alkylhydroperoxidase family enzyme
MITFRSTATRARAECTWEVTGDLTVRDVTRPVVVQVDFEGASPSPFGDERIAFSAAADVNRDDLGLTWSQTLETGGMLVGKTARIELYDAARAALAYTEAITRVADATVADDFCVRHAALAERFSQEEILEIIGIVINMNVWTRLKLAEGASPGLAEQTMS